MSTTVNTHGNDTVVTQGWTSAPNSRGTIDIIFSCLTTLILCSWSCICCNIPEPHESYLRYAFRKCWLFITSILGPEFLLYFALGQWLSAKQSVQAFRRLGYKQWSMRHAFYADMGGFLIKLNDEDAFPLDTKSLLWLIEEGFIEQKQIYETVLLDSKQIEDRNKTDGIVRLIAVAQIVWFTINVIARLCASYPVAALELTVLSYLVPSAVTYWLWWYKPRDVQTAQTLTIDVSTAKIHDRAGPGAATWYRSPFDFVERREFIGSLIVQSGLHTLKKLLKVRPGQSKPRTQKKPRLRRSDNDFLPSDHVKDGWIEYLPSIPCLGIPFVAWNSYFPSKYELWLWRCSAIGMAAAYICGGIWASFFMYKWPPDIQKEKLRQYRVQAETIKREMAQHKEAEKRGRKTLSLMQRFIRKWKLKCQAMRNNSSQDDPNLDVLLRLLIPAYVLGLFYALCRAYMICEDFIELRSMPADLYITYDWIQSIPHLF